MVNYERYQSLVKEAWQHYYKSDYAGMARLLEQSLEYTPYLKSETISDWVFRFTQFCSDVKHKLDLDFLSNLGEWQSIVLSILEIKCSDKDENPQKSLESIQILSKVDSNLGTLLEKNQELNNHFSEIQFRKEVQDTIETDGVRGIYQLIHKYLTKSVIDEFNLNSLTFSEIKDSYTEESIQFGEKAFQMSGNIGIAKVLSVRYRQIGDLYRAYELLKYVKNKTG
ncbi:hypothetical protein V6O07_03160, partial [Arthrospira platensis SPKY2]